MKKKIIVSFVLNNNFKQEDNGYIIQKIRNSNNDKQEGLFDKKRLYNPYFHTFLFS